MDAPDPYRQYELEKLIRPDRRFLPSALVGAVVGAVVATTVTLAIVRPREVPAPSNVDSNAGVAARPACKLDRTLGVVVQRNPLPDVARYPGSLVRTSVGDVPHNTAHVVLETCDSPADVLAFYRANHGLTLDGETSERDQRRLTFTKDDGRGYTLVFEVSVTPREEGTRIDLVSSLPRQNTSLLRHADVF